MPRFFCPFRNVLDYTGTDSPTPDEIAAADQTLRVSERLVHTTHVNKRVIDRRQFEQVIKAGEASDAPYSYSEGAGAVPASELAPLALASRRTSAIGAWSPVSRHVQGLLSPMARGRCPETIPGSSASIAYGC